MRDNKARTVLNCMELHEVVHQQEADVRIMRVPNGWVYTFFDHAGGDIQFQTSSVFVPEIITGRRP